MEPTLFFRVALPGLLIAFFAVLMVWPVVRLRRRAGVQAVTLHRESAPGQRISAVAFVALQLGVVALAIAYATGGPEAVGVWPLPPPMRWIGLAGALAGLVVVAVAQRQMGASFRIGIDDRPTPLVVSGLFGIVRNPIFTGLLGLLAGVFCIVPGPCSLALLAGTALTVSFQTRLEERHLLAMHGDAYRRHAARVGRFLPGIGRLR